MNPFILIPWSLLTHTFDSLQHEKSHLIPMTYLDLLTEIQNLSEEELLKPVQCYDQDCEELLPVFSFDGVTKDDPFLII